MTEPTIYHWTPDIIETVVVAVPALVRSKQSVIDFFRGAGVSGEILAGPQHKIVDRGYTKFHATREIVTAVNDQGDKAIRERREVVRRICQWDDFDSCYEDNRLKAQGAVAKLSRLVSIKDAPARVRQAAEQEAAAHRKRSERAAAEARSTRTKAEALKDNLYGLFRNDLDPVMRGTALERLLNEIFEHAGIAVRESFIVRSEETNKAISQIDGVVDIDNKLYLVEMKWWSEEMAASHVAQHLVRVYQRADAGGIFIAAQGYKESAIADHKKALSHRTVFLVDLEEIVHCLEGRWSLVELLREKIKAAILDGNVRFRPPLGSS